MQKARFLLSQLILQADYTLQDEQDYNRLLYSIDRLVRNNFSDEVILNTLVETDLSALTPQTLPEAFWKNSLLNPHSFYFHSALRLTARPRKFCAQTRQFENIEPFYLEPRICFTLLDCLNYFYNMLQTPYVLQQEKKDKGSILHLLEKYNALYIEKIKVQSIDYILFLIDYAKEQEDVTPYFSLFDCENRYGAKAFGQFVWQITQSITSGHDTYIYKGGF